MLCVYLCADVISGAPADEGGGEVCGHGAAPHRQLQEGGGEKRQAISGHLGVQFVSIV